MKFILLCLVFAHIEAIQVSLSLARSNLAATSVNNLAIFAGGNSGTSTDEDAIVDIFNSDGILINTTYLSVPRLYLAATTINGLAMFAGGANSSEYFNSVDIYNSSSGLWTTSSLSEKRAIFSATTVGNLALFAGGQNSSGPSDRVDIFNSTSGKWTYTSLSEPRIGTVATTVGNFALFGGGSNATGLSSRVDIYDATSGKWETASLSEARNWLAATSGGELALFGGGQNAIGESARVDIFNATSKMWTTAALSQARSFFAATTVGDLAIFGCGANGDYLYTPAVDILNVKTNTWTTATMTPARGSLAATSFGNLAWFGGGYMNQQGNFGPASAVNIFSLCNNDTVTQKTLNCNPPNPPNPPQSATKTWIYIVSAICGALLIAIGIVISIVVRRRHGYKLLSQSSLQQIQNVSILERLGGGQFGDVYRGTMEDSIDVALKKLKSETDTKEFEREAEILCALNHPNIVRFYGIHKSLLGQKYIVLEYMSEGALNHFLQRTPLQIYDLLTIAKHVIAGMRYLGENRIIHRDLACRNLLVAKEQKYIVKVGDFGMSRSAEKGYYTNNETKIPFKWSAPELIQYGTSTVKGDIWSFGVCLWEIFSLGKTPYATWTNRELMQKLLSGERLEQPENCPDKVYEWMQSCWRLDPMARPSFEELGDLLQKYMHESYQQESYIANAIMLTTPSGSTTEMSVYN